MKVGWICAGSINSGGARMSVFHNHEYFCNIGVNSKIIHSPATYCLDYNPTDQEIVKIIDEKYDVVFIQKVCNEKTKSLVEQLQKNNVVVGYGIGDFFGQNMIDACDFTVASSEYLRGLYSNESKNKIYVIMDGYESIKLWPLQRETQKEEKIENFLKIVYYGTQNIDQEFEKNIKKIDNIVFKKIGNKPWADIPWEIDTIYRHISESDICIVFSQINDFNKSKSINRPLNCMCIGVPVITSPIPSYYNIIKNGYNGFICENNTFNEFKKYIEILKDPIFRKKISKRSIKTTKNYSIENQSKKYLELFSKKTYENNTK